MAIAIVFGVLAYVAFLVGMISLSVRWSRNNLKKRNDALVAGLGGAKQIGETKKATLYQGAETEYEVGGRRVFVNTLYQNRSWIRASLKIKTGPYPWVTVFPEGKIERFGKAIGLNREVQTGDKAFDDLAYIDTIDTEENVRRLFESAAARGAIAELLQLGFKVQLSKEGAEAFELLRAGEQLDGSKAAQGVAALGRLADTLPTFPGTALENPRSPGRVGFAVMLVVSWIAGFLSFGFTGESVSRTLDGGASGLVFILGGGVAWLVYVAALVAGVRGRSYALRTVFIGGFVGLLGIPVGGGGLVHWLNQQLDHSASTEHKAVVLLHHKSKEGCRLSVESWTGGPNLRLYFKHKGGDSELPPGALVTVRSHPGAFGLEWHERIAADGR